jgi:zinc/manganese transport system substrate-binding protein
MTLLVAACGDAAADGRPRVVATTTILGDLVANVVGDEAVIEVLLPVGADPHDYRASARQVAALQEAELVVVNGLDLEEGLADVLANAERDGANILALAPQLDPLPFATGSLDPHVWLDPLRMAAAAELVATALAAAAPGVDWAAPAEAYASELRRADERIESILAPVPPARRKLITNHDSLGYFAARYGFTVVGVVIPGGSTLAEPSPAALAELVATIQREDLPAVFAETTEPTTLAATIAAAAGREVAVVQLHTGSLGDPAGPAATLVGMLVENAERIAGALAAAP